MNATLDAADPLHIFLVENHVDTLRWLTVYLEELGHIVQSAMTLTEALKKLPGMLCDVLITDIGLPDGDGREVLRRSKLGPEVYAVAMSGFGMNADRALSEEAGFRRHLLKPFVPDELDGLLAEATRERNARAAA